MAVEIERKFLVRPGLWTPRDAGEYIRQGYMQASSERASVRVRVRGRLAFLTVKGPTSGISRLEYEYDIPVTDAMEMLDRLCGAVLEKTRHVEVHGSHTWEVDVFRGANSGLIVAEVEIRSEREVVELPPWVGDEVSHDPRYRNSALAREPFSLWANRR